LKLTSMRKLLASLTFGLAAWSGAYAAEETSAFYPLIGFGLTFGGTTLANVQYVNGNSCNIHAGGLGDVYAGVDYRRRPVSVQVTAGYHFDTCDGSNGSLRFSRYPVELLAYYGFGENWRAGGGVRFVMDPHISGGGVAGGTDVKFRSATGAVLEGEYLLSRTGWVQFGFKLRYVFEHYQPEFGGASVSGNHVGALVNTYF
jgi:hypothetical protein